MENLYLKWIGRLASRTNLLVLGVMLALIALIVRPSAAAEVSRWSGGQGMLRLPFFATAEDLLPALAAYGEGGRNAYFFVVLTVENVCALLWFLLYSVLFYLLLPFKLKEMWKPLWRIAPLLFLLDLSTNALLMIILARFPEGSSFYPWCYLVLSGIRRIVFLLAFLLAGWLVVQEGRHQIALHRRRI